MIKTGHELTDQQIAARYEAFGGELAMRPYFYPAVAAFVGPVEGDVLDAGCGPGLLLAELRKKSPHARLFGLEIAAANVEATRRRLNGAVDARIGSVLQALPFSQDQRFDLILLTEVLEHVKEPVQALINLRQWLKPNGHMVITLPNAAAWLPFSWLAERLVKRARFFRGWLPHEHPLRTEQPIDTAFSRREALEWIEAAGLKVVAQTCHEVFPWALELFYKFTPGFEPLPKWWRPLDSLCARAGLFDLGYRVFVRCALR
ncbi:MAG: class I SAM-dependent methyltransferase [Anaerolineae bacterium]